MAALALAGITDVYLCQVRKMGVLGGLGYVLFAAGNLSMLGPNTLPRWCFRPWGTVQPRMSTT